MKKLLRRILRAPGVPQSRHLAEKAVAPFLRDDLHNLNLDHHRTSERVADLESTVGEAQVKIAALKESLDQLNIHQPAILNAIASSNGTARILRREFDQLREELQPLNAEVAQLRSIDERLHGELQGVHDAFTPHIDTIRYLLSRVEMIRAEFFHELRYGPALSLPRAEAKIQNPEALERDNCRLNLGAGHLPMDGYINVDMRELPGIDIIAPIDALPFESGTIDEIFSSHTLEHFTESELERRLLPYWRDLLRSGGLFRAVVPDTEANLNAHAKREMSFEELREVTFGGQEYEGDFHFTAFTPDSLAGLLRRSGFVDVRVTERARRNGMTFEFDIVATRA